MLTEHAVCISMGCIIVTAVIVVAALLLRKRKYALHLTTGGVYLALLFLYLGFTQGAEEPAKAYRFLFACHDAMKVFFMGHDFTDILNFSAEQLGRDCTAYAAFLFVLAPALTFSSILSLFSNLVDRLRYMFYPGGTKYILSEMNEESLVLAESIRKAKPHTQIVFAGAGKTAETGDSTLMERARNLGALCLKQPVSRFVFRNPLQKKVIFLINRHEPENVAAAAALVEKYKNTQHNVALYVYATALESKTAIDYLDKGTHVLPSDFRSYLDTHLPEILKQKDLWNKPQTVRIFSEAPLESNFSVRCIDPVEQTVQKVLKENYGLIHDTAKADKTVRITILGFGNHGMAVLKSASWMFQLYGYRLEINVFDMDGTCRKRLQQEAPELLQNPGSSFRDDASHDILFMGEDQGIDCLSADFDEHILEKYWNRLENTQLVFISTGDDSRNIAVAMHVRELFQRRKIESALQQVPAEARKQAVTDLKDQFEADCKKESPLICAVVTDINRSRSITPDCPDSTESSKETPDSSKTKKQNRYEYHILPVGTLTEVYDFQRIEKLMELEKNALWHHLAWSLKKILKKECEEVTSDMLNKLVQNTEMYVKDSYFRNSSMATSLHQELLREVQQELEKTAADEKIQEELMEMVTDKKLQNALQEITSGRKAQTEKEKKKTNKKYVTIVKQVTEHMRWNAYMRALGYRQCDVRNDRAKLHPLIVPYHDLSPADQDKDLVDFDKEET